MRPSMSDTGSGPAVLMAHGTLMDWTMFQPQIDALAGRNRVVAFNQRARIPDKYDMPYDLGMLAEDCARLMDGLGIERCVLLGMSMGGYMAMEFAIKYPDRLDGLIMVGSQVGAYSAEQQAAFNIEFDKFGADELTPRAMALWSAPLCFGATTLADREALVTQWVDYWCTLPGRSVMYEGRSWLSKADRSAEAALFGKPVLIVHGEEDAVLPIDEKAVGMERAFPNARLVRVPGAGHTVNVECPEPVNAAIIHFLSEIGY